MADWKAKLKALGPCPEAYRWAIKHKTLREAWRMCERGDWMEWLLIVCTNHNATYDAMYETRLAVKETRKPPWRYWSMFSEYDLQDACIYLDFMPDPPRLPEIGHA